MDRKETGNVAAKMENNLEGLKSTKITTKTTTVDEKAN